MKLDDLKSESIDIPKTNKKRVVILGGGFGGLNAAATLDSKYFQTILLDKNNFHTFQPLLYQVAGAGIEPDSICSPIRKILTKKPDFHFRMATVESVDPERKQVTTNRGTLPFDDLIIASGAETTFFQNSAFEKHTYPLKELDDAISLRNRIFSCMESAMFEKHRHERHALMTFVVVGGGPTGVEIAGALAELKRHVLPKDYPDLETELMTIYLVEGTDRLLSGMSKKASARAALDLEKMGIHVLLNRRVAGYDGQTLLIGSNEKIAAETVIWAAGVSPRRILGLVNPSLDKGRILVDPFNRVLRENSSAEPHIFAIGDICCMRLPDYPDGLPGMAPAAIQQGLHLARNLNRREKHRQPEPFRFRDKGVMATIGRNLAVAEIAGITVTGFFGWFLWMAIHLWYLIGFRNKAVVFVNWMISYFTYERGVRIIAPPREHAPSRREPAVRPN